MMIKDLLKRNKVIRSAVRAWRRIEYKRMARKEGSPFDGDQIIKRTVDFLLTNCDVKCFIETGTFLGQTCRYIASRNPDLPLITIESNPDYFISAQSVLRRYGNIKSILGNSAVTISELVQNGIEGLPFFYLDAHWYNYLPLPDEIRSIGRYCNDAIIIIHDFQVPGMDCEFGVCNGKAIGVEMLAASIDKSKSYNIYFPCYTYEQAYGVLPQPHQTLAGYAILFQGAREAVDRFAASEHIQWCIRGALE